MNRKLLIIFCILSMHFFNLFSEIKMVSYKIIDGVNGMPLPGANIFLKNNIFNGTISNLEGDFNLEIPASSFSDSIIVSFVGYEEKIIAVPDLLNNSGIIAIYPKPHEIEETVIIARNLISEEFTIEKIEQMDIYMNPLSKADPLLAVNGLASSTTTDESASISLRGSSPAETGIFFNDVPVYDAVRFSQINGIGTFSIFNTSVVDQMHVFPGNPPIEYGNSTSGLVTIHSSNQIPENWYHSVSLSLANLSALTSGNINENNGITLFTNYQPSAVFIGINQEAMRDLSSFNTFDLGIHYQHSFKKSCSLKIFNYTNTEGYGFYLRHPSYNGLIDQNKKRDFIIANFSKQYKNAELNLNGGFSLSEEKYDYGNTDICIDKRDIYLSANYYRFIKKLSIKTGLSFDNRKSDFSGFVPVFSYAIAPDQPSVKFNSKDNLPIIEGYFYTKYKLSENLVIGTGLRKNIAVNDLKNYLSYQINLVYMLNNLHSFTLSGGKYNKYCIPSSDIHNKYLINNEQLSIDYNFKIDYIEITSALFYKNSKYEQKAEEAFGGEAFIKTSITKKLVTQFSYTYMDVSLKTNENEYPSNYDFNYFIRGSFELKLKNNFTISTIGLFRQGECYTSIIQGKYENFPGVYSPVYDTQINNSRKPAYSRVDLNVTKLYSINNDMMLIAFFNISNVLNRNNVRDINYNSDYTKSFYEYFSKRTVYFGVILNFQK